MKANKALKELIDKDGRSKEMLASLMGISSANLINRTKRENMSVDNVVSMLSVLGYEVVIRPKQKKHKDSEIVIDIEE